MEVETENTPANTTADETAETSANSTLPTHPTQVLIAEDDVPLANFVQRVLRNDSYAVDLAHDGETARQALSQRHYDLLILDLNMPKLDGMELLRLVRPSDPRLSVLVLTARSRVEDRIMALNCGADDCLIKPFSFPELTARVRALLRRNHQTLQANPIQVGDLILNREEYRVERSGKKLDLTAKEFALLEYLMANARHPVTRSMIMENVWREPYDGSSNLVDVYVKYVRDKVDSDFPTKLVRTVRGVGYVVTEN
jgi:DNA-binding response OmpR family regulator